MAVPYIYPVIGRLLLVNTLNPKDLGAFMTFEHPDKKQKTDDPEKARKEREKRDPIYDDKNKKTK